MTSLIHIRDRFDVAFANDTDADRHGIVTRSNGLMNPNHFLAAELVRRADGIGTIRRAFARSVELIVEMAVEALLQ